MLEIGRAASNRNTIKTSLDDSQIGEKIVYGFLNAKVHTMDDAMRTGVVHGLTFWITAQNDWDEFYYFS